MRDAYFILGYEYYKLAEEAKATGKSEKADDLYKRATFYTLFYRDMDRLAKTCVSPWEAATEALPTYPPAHLCNPRDFSPSRSRPTGPSPRCRR